MPKLTPNQYDDLYGNVLWADPEASDLLDVIDRSLERLSLQEDRRMEEERTW